MNPLIYLVLVFKAATGGTAVIYDEPFNTMSECAMAKAILIEAARQTPETDDEIAVGICAAMLNSNGKNT